MQKWRQIALLVCALALGAVALFSPADRENIVDATQFSIAFFATLLTGEAVIFALTFSAASSWPSLRAIDSHIAFREWVLIGWFAALFTACGLLGDSTISATYGALLFLLANVFGIFSFIRLFGLASVGGRNRLLQRTLAGALIRPQPATTPHAPAPPGLEDDPILAAYLGTVGQAAGSNDPTGIRNLVDQLVAAQVPPHAADHAIAVQLNVLHRLARAALTSGADPIVITGCADTLIDSILQRARSLAHPAPALGATSRYLAWLASTAHLMSVRAVASNRAARELVAMSTDNRLKILRRVDPDPKSAGASDEVGSILPDPLQLLLWTADFCEFHGAHQASAFYGVFEALTGTKFMGNYWDGASILTQLRTALYDHTNSESGSGSDSVRTPEADATRQVFGSLDEFDRFWALISVNALATLRDTRQPHPPELIRPEFTPDPRLLGAYLRTFATHRYFTTATQAQEALLGLISRTDPPGSPSEEIRITRERAAYRTPAPPTAPRQRPAAMVLAIATRLAPLTSGEPDTELRTFLTTLPTPALKSAADLAARILPGAADEPDPHQAIVTGLKVLQLVGAHTWEDR
ncbi:hypothetical protein ACFQVC_13095 [Streptomyces monticola]|uniref:DUF2254 domain-containing protein n=1 Tax=Streptomyces monticola TaxID=2666263 RepID=A0ABW2JGG6_9ACTN